MRATIYLYHIYFIKFSGLVKYFKSRGWQTYINADI